MPTLVAATLTVATFLSTVTDRLAGWFGVERPSAASPAVATSDPAPLAPRNGHDRHPPRLVRATGGRFDPEFFLNARLRSGHGFGSDDPLRQHTWYYTILTQRASQVQQARFAIYPRDDSESQDELADHPLTRLLRRPNPTMTASDLWYVTNMQRDDKGEAFWLLDRSAPGVYPKRIWPMPGGAAWKPTNVLPDGSAEAWELRRNGKKYTYEPWQVVLFRHPDPDDALRGMSPRVAAQRAVDTDVLLREYNADFFRNGASPGGWLKVPGNLSLDDYERLEGGWQDRHGGPGNNHRFGILEGGMEWVATSISQRDMEFLETRRWSREELAGCFHWPLWMLTDDAANYATAAMSRARLWFEVVIPILKQFESALDAQLFRDLPDDVVGAFDLDSVPALVEYRRELWDTALKMQQAGVSLEECNRVLDLGIEEQDGWGEVWRPMGMAPTSELTLLGAAPTPSPAPTEGAPEATDPKPTPSTPTGESVQAQEALNGAQVTAIVTIAKEVASGVLPKSSAIAIATVAFPITEAQAQDIFGDIEIGVLPPAGGALAKWEAEAVRKIRAATDPAQPSVRIARAMSLPALRRYHRLYRRQVAEPAERRGRTVFATYLKQLAQEQDARFEKAAKSRGRTIADTLTIALPPTATETVAEWQMRELLAAGREGLAQHRAQHGTGGTRLVTPEALLEILFPLGTWDSTLRAAFRPYVTSVAMLSGAFTEGSLSTFGVEFDITSERVLSFLEERVQKVVGINQRVQTALANTLNEGFVNGESLEELRSRVQGVTAALRDPNRAMMIARTESATLANGVRFQMGEPGADTQTWIDSGDDVTRQSHKDTAAASRREPVPVGQPFLNGLLYPGDPGAPAAERIACRCSAVLNPRNQEVPV